MIDTIVIGGLLIMLFYHLILTFILKDKVYLYYVSYNFFLVLTLMVWKGWIDVLEFYELPIEDRTRLFVIAVMSSLFFYTLFVINYLDLKKFKPRFNVFIKYYLWIIAAIIVSFVLNIQIVERIGKLLPINHILLTFTLFIVALSLWNKNPLVKIFLLGDSFFMLSFTLSPLSFILFQVFELPVLPLDFSNIQMIDIGAYIQQIIFAYSLALRIQLSNKEKNQAQAETIKIQQEANQQLEQKVQERTHQLHETNEELELSIEQINVKNQELGETLNTLRSTQAQLIQSEKLASLGELTAGIAHEIQNPLNFVNNFAEVSVEMLDEMKEEIKAGNTSEVIAIADDLEQNLSKINHHGQRASAIVKGMLEHSRASTGVKEPTDLNALADEFLRLAYHGLRAKDNNFNATLETHFDPNLPKVSVIPQDIGRVLLNLINNAFYAVAERSRSTVQQRDVETLHATSLQHPPYQPTVSVSTKRLENAIEIRVEDNGNGIPEGIKEKIFQPFFTTKPTGQGTGLGLSLAYDIVTKGHGGVLEVESKTGDGTTFTIQLPDPKNR
ncbi:MAG: ATP-binding protein [Haliscomenobacter sp.]|nr:ATP-binding protein [Haliscomenobacter sp.]MDX2071819.1 ATP-binding protein [Haliscomenobacter sp.]